MDFITEKMNTDIIKSLTQRIDSFPTLPAITTQIMSIISDSESSSEDLMKAVTPDQSLTTMILKMANSAFFGMSRKVSSLQNAITILGFRAIRNIVLAKSVFESFRNVGFEKKFDIRTFWEHSFLCALAAKVIAEKLKAEKSDFFVAGLIHDIGKLIIYITFPIKFMEILELAGPIGPNYHKAERKVLGITHDEVAMALLNRWLFPEKLVEAVGFHHRPCLSQESFLFPGTIYAADLLVYGSGVNEQGKPLRKEVISSEAFEKLHSLGMKWDETDFDELFQALEGKKEEELETLRIIIS